MAPNRSNRQQMKNSKKINSLDLVARKLLTTIDSGFAEREILSEKDRRIQSIINNELTLAKGVSNGSIIDFVANMSSNNVQHNKVNPMDRDPSDLFTQDITNIFGYFQDMYKNRYTELADLQFISKFIPAIGEAVRTTLDSVVSSDDMSTTITRNLDFGPSLSDIEKARVTAEIERNEKEEKLLKKLRNIVYKKALISGMHFVYAISYNELFQEYDRLVKAGKILNGNIAATTPVARRKSTGIGKNTGFNLAAESVTDDIPEWIATEAVNPEMIMKELSDSGFSEKEAKEITTVIDDYGINITTTNSPYMAEAIESIAALETYKDYYMNDLTGYANTFGGIGKLNTGFVGTTDGSYDPNAHGSKFNTTGTYIKYIDASKLVPVKVYNQIVGYFHVHDTSASKKAGKIKSQDNMILGSVNLFANINLSDDKRENAVKVIVDTITDGILANFSGRFVNNNAEHKKLIADCIIGNGFINNNLQIQFIPAQHIVPFIINETEEGIGQSILNEALFPARLLLNLIISKMLLYMNKSGNRTIAFVRKGPIDVNSANHIQRTIRQLQEANITFADLLATNLSFAKFAPYGNIQIPMARNGDRLVDFETQEGQNIDMKTDFEDMLEKMAIMGTGVPSVILEYTDAADYAKSIVSANIKFAGRISTLQSDLEDPTTDLYKIIIKNSNLDEDLKVKVLRDFKFKLPRPRVASNANMADFLSSMQSTANTLADLRLGQDTGNDPDYQLVRNEYIAATVIDHLPWIDWNEDIARLENARLKVIEAKKLKDNTNGDTTESDSNIDDQLINDSDLL